MLKRIPHVFQTKVLDEFSGTLLVKLVWSANEQVLTDGNRWFFSIILVFLPNWLSLWLQITEGLKKLCGKNTVRPQKLKKNPKTPKETNKNKSKIKVIAIFTSELQFKFFNVHVFTSGALSAFHNQILYTGWMFIRKNYLFSRPERRSGPYNT